MAAPTSRSRTIREEVTLADERPVQLQSQRRFFSNQGNDRATREARALTNVFAAGTEFLNDRAIRKNEEGRAEAITSRGAGEDRAVDEKNQGYNMAWDQLDAESDLNLAMKELPAYLESIDAESLNEEAFQGVISEYMQGQFDGIDPNSAYGKVLAPGLLRLEQELLAQHRDNIIESIRADQSQKVTENAEERIAAAGGDWTQPSEVDGKNVYEYIADATNTFEDGPEKKAAYWDTLYHFAITSGRPELIEDSPLEFPNGEPTGLKDSRLLAQHDAAIKAALAQKGKNLLAEQKAADAQNAQDIFDLQFSIYAARQSGQDVSAYILELAKIPGVEMSDISTAKNFGDSQLDERESRSGDLGYTSALWNMIHEGNAGLEAVWFAKTEGLLGQGPQSEDTMNAMMNEVKSMQSNREALSTAEVTQYRSILDQTYDKSLGGLAGAINPVMLRINIDAKTMYNRLISEDNMSGWEALGLVRARFDPMVDGIDVVSDRELQGRRSQSDFTAAEVITPEAVQEVVDDPRLFGFYLGGVPSAILESALWDHVDNGTITEEQLKDLVKQSR